MKQIILKSQTMTWSDAACPGRLLAIWGLFGIGAAMLWRMAGADLWAEAGVWIVALIAALGLLLASEV
ncbi:MAG: hypothetical protein WB609_10570 [Candidatus Cybelea sp.]